MVTIGQICLMVTPAMSFLLHLREHGAKFIQGEMSWEDWVSASTGIGPGASTSLFEQALVDGKTFNSSMNKIVDAYNDMSPEEQVKLKNQLVYHNIIYPFIGEDGLGLLGKKGAFYDKPAKKLTDDMIEQKKLKAFAMFVPVIMRALREVDDDYINKSGKGLKQIMNMMEKSGIEQYTWVDYTPAQRRISCLITVKVLTSLVTHIQS